MAKVHWADDVLPPKDRSIYVMNRTALDSFGRLGSLFNGYRDEVINTVIIIHCKKSGGYRDIRRCKIICGSKDIKENIHGMVEIDDATRLSLLLNLRENAGISRIIQCNIPIKENTRLFWFTHIKRIHQLPDDPEHIRYTDSQIKSQLQGTHIITSVEWGIEVAIVLQLPNDADTMKEIDSVLQKIRNLLLTNQGISSLEPTEQIILNKIINTKVYSNIYDIKLMSTLFDVFTYIDKNKQNIIDRPISYKIRPITWLFPQYANESNRFLSPPAKLLNSVERYIIQINTHMKQLIALAERELSQRLAGKLPKVLRSAQKMCSNVKYQCENEIERFTRLILAARRGEIELSKIRNALRDDQSMMVKMAIRNLDRTLHDLETKAVFIHELNEQHFRYINASDYGIKRKHNIRIIEIEIIRDEQHDRILCSNDMLNNVDQKQFCNLRDKLIKERENNSDLRLFYADFSYCSYKLKKMTLLPRSVFYVDKTKKTGIQDSAPKPVLSLSTKISNTKIVTMSQRTDVSLSSHSSTSSEGSCDEKMTLIETNVGTPINDNSIIDIQTYNDIFTKINIYADTPGETIYVALKPVEIPSDDTPAQTRTQTPVQSSVDVPVKSEVSLPSTVRKPVIAVPPKPKDPLQLPPIANLENKIINILLIGETSVGKSTFINALANYLTFDTMEEAEKNPPVVLIPGSFLVTGSDKTEQRIVKFGDMKDEQIKHLDHPGRSITVRCRSYEFDLTDINDQKIRFIDTPGFGDARGLLQDDHHMQHIMKYIKQYTPLNAICFFLNVDDIRVNIFLRSCLTQLFSFLGRDIRSRIIFCFTGSRPAFYAPGKTFPLLKRILSSFALVNIPLTKANTFCYDNESFRYLVGLQNGIDFSDLEKKDCEMSWSKSVVETKRFLQYVCGKRLNA